MPAGHPCCACWIAVLLIAGNACAGVASTIQVVVNRGSGEIAFVNSNLTPATIVGYSIGSSGSLRPQNWLSIADNYDADSGGLIDPDNIWLVFSSPSTTNLAEGTFATTGGALFNPGQSLSLGNAWNPLGAMDLEVSIVNPSNQTLPVDVEFRLVGDYNGNGLVDAADYSVWRDSLGGSTLNNRDPLLTGAVGQDDYLAWKSNFGVSFGSGAAAVATAAVPEPAGMILVAAGLAVLTACRRSGFPA